MLLDFCIDLASGGIKGGLIPLQYVVLLDCARRVLLVEVLQLQLWIDLGVMIATQIFEQLRIQSTMLLQAFQVLAVVFVEFGAVSFQNKTIWKCFLDFLVVLPLIGGSTNTLQHCSG